MTDFVFGAPEPDADFRNKLRRSLAKSIKDHERRQARRAAKGRPRVAVTVTVHELMAMVRAADWRCALSRLPFWSGDGGTYGPTIPSMDRIEPEGPYSAENVRVVLLGVNSLKGSGSDGQMYRIAAALLAARRQRRV
jgi:hypothetical protein